jgi:hypothetical protein
MSTLPREPPSEEGRNTITTMLPPVDSSCLQRNANFETLYKDLTTRKLNPDGSTRDTKKQRIHDEIRRVRSFVLLGAPLFFPLRFARSHIGNLSLLFDRIVCSSTCSVYLSDERICAYVLTKGLQTYNTIDPSNLAHQPSDLPNPHNHPLVSPIPQHHPPARTPCRHRDRRRDTAQPCTNYRSRHSSWRCGILSPKH